MNHGFVAIKKLSQYAKIYSTATKTMYVNVAKQPDATMIFILYENLLNLPSIERPVTEKSYTKGEAQE